MRYFDVVEEMIWEHLQAEMIDPSLGLSPERPIKVCCMMDGFPVDTISLTQWCVALASLKPDLCDQSEALLRCFAITGLSESNAKFHRTLSENHLGDDLTQIVTTSKIFSDRLLTRYVDQYYAADKKANDAGRGCAPGCAHCMCPLDNRLKLPWSLDRPPDTWDDADAACEAICVHRNPEY